MPLPRSFNRFHSQLTQWFVPATLRVWMISSLSESAWTKNVSAWVTRTLRVLLYVQFINCRQAFLYTMISDIGVSKLRNYNVSTLSDSVRGSLQQRFVSYWVIGSWFSKSLHKNITLRYRTSSDPWDRVWWTFSRIRANCIAVRRVLYTCT